MNEKITNVKMQKILLSSDLATGPVPPLPCWTETGVLQEWINEVAAARCFVSELSRYRHFYTFTPPGFLLPDI